MMIIIIIIIIIILTADKAIRITFTYY